MWYQLIANSISIYIILLSQLNGISIYVILFEGIWYQACVILNSLLWEYLLTVLVIHDTNLWQIVLVIDNTFQGYLAAVSLVLNMCDTN